MRRNTNRNLFCYICEPILDSEGYCVCLIQSILLTLCDHKWMSVELWLLPCCDQSQLTEAPRVGKSVLETCFFSVPRSRRFIINTREGSESFNWSTFFLNGADWGRSGEWKHFVSSFFFSPVCGPLLFPRGQLILGAIVTFPFVLFFGKCAQVSTLDFLPPLVFIDSSRSSPWFIITFVFLCGIASFRTLNVSHTTTLWPRSQSVLFTTGFQGHWDRIIW